MAYMSGNASGIMGGSRPKALRRSAIGARQTTFHVRMYTWKSRSILLAGVLSGGMADTVLVSLDMQRHWRQRKRIPQSSSTQSHRSRVQIIQFRLVRASRRSKSGPPVTSGKSFSCSQTRPNTCHEKHGARYAARPRLAAATARNKLVQHDTLAFS